MVQTNSLNGSARFTPLNNLFFVRSLYCVMRKCLALARIYVLHNFMNVYATQMPRKSKYECVGRCQVLQQNSSAGRSKHAAY